MFVPKLVSAFATAALVALGSSATAQPGGDPPGQPAAQAEVRLEALGGASVKAPAAWKEVRKEAALVVREQAADPAGQKPFFVLLTSIEEGPPVGTPDSTSPGVPWLKVRDNIVESASKNGRTVRLDVGDAWKGVAGFEARRFHGELEGPPTAGAPAGAPRRKVAITLIALVKDTKLVTVGIVSEPAHAEAARELVASIAQTAKLGPQ